MKLAFYYHIPIYCDEAGNYFLPGYLGVFIDELAKNVKTLVLVMHTASDKNGADYQLNSANISLIDLGRKTTAWHRGFFHHKILHKKLDSLRGLNAFLVRSPSPLAPYFYKYLPAGVNIIYYLVGSYTSSAKHMKISGIRSFFVQKFMAYNTYAFEKNLKQSNLLVNSPELLDLYKKKANSIAVVRTTTLTKHDFYVRNDTCQNKTIKLLYTGRIDLAKGLVELIKATAQLIEIKVHSFELHLVGWEDDSLKSVELVLRNLVNELGIKEYVVFHGFKNIGKELNEMYRMADIFIMPSYHEGFPRSIWEAMANSLPVIATRVGAIPSYLVHQKHALLIDAHSVEHIVIAVNSICKTEILRKKLIRNEYDLAAENTLEKQVELLLKSIKRIQ